MRFQSFNNLFRQLLGRSDSHLEVRFRKIYKENLFGGCESRSGTGSTREQTVVIRRELPRLLSKMKVTSLLDAPCGDCNWIQDLDWSVISYTGADIVPDLIKTNQGRFASTGMKFIAADLCTSELPLTDLIFCRDCWVHLNYAQIRSCLANFSRSGARYLLTTTFADHPVNRDLGRLIWRPLNLQAAPFGFPPPLELLNEGCTEGDGQFADKSLGLWRLKDLVFS